MAGRISDEPEYTQGCWKHGRFYGNWRPDKYLFPIDREETDRCDTFHKFFQLARKNQVFSYPILRGNARVLDLGTGTGIWAIDVAENYLKWAHVMAVDLNKIQPALIPPNVEMVQFDIEEASWEPLLKDCDLVHMRLLLGSIHNTLWPNIYRNAYAHTTPGGYIEQVEIHWLPSWEGIEQPAVSAFKNWAEFFLQGMDNFERSARVDTKGVKKMMEAAGYVNFEERTMRCYVNPWRADPDENKVASWFNYCLIEGLQAMSLEPLIGNLRKSHEEVDKLLGNVKQECCLLRYHAYCVM
ncbi:methyltransferase LaeA [Cordyceps militaris]|uniref:Methyltransferase LaeA n=1 Tax=Cordyceps militaris TaxID=73501 RepID=A0A2H4S608_CORMI|nr:methyltransferase LaeA [Cordyceps militaris]